MDLFSDQTPWPKTFKNYYQTYDKVMKVSFPFESSLFISLIRDNQEKRQRVTQEKSFIQKLMLRLRKRQNFSLKTVQCCS